MALAAGMPAGAPPSCVLEITGTPDAAFSGECTLERDGRPQRLVREGAPPLRREPTGIAVSCRLSQTSALGRVSISVRRPDGGSSQTASLQGRGSTAAVPLR